MKTTTRPHAALFASSGMGHLIPVLELAKRLISNHNFHVTVFVLAIEETTAKKQLSELPDSDLIDLIALPPVDMSGLVDPTTHVVSMLAIMMRESVPGLRSAISAMENRPTLLIVDLFGTEALPVANEFMMGKYVFIASNAWFTAMSIYFPTVSEMEKDEHIKEKQPLEIPGCKPVRFEDTFDCYMDRTDQLYDEYLRIGLEMVEADGMLINTFEDLEPTTLSAMRDYKKLGRVADLPVYTIGPIVRPTEPEIVGNRILEWLDNQPDESVIYISFGTGGILPSKQLTELAWGLEQSQQRFIWVVRPPMDSDASGTSLDGTPNYFPEGFMTRTKDRGLIITNWAPQILILSHPAVGGFLSHCGWNSTMETLVNGVPMIVWPLYAEQRMNAALLTEEIGMAIRPKSSESTGIVNREELETVVRKIMVDEEGDGIRKRVKELKHSAEKALGKDGSSSISLSDFARECEISLKARAQGA